MLHTLGQYIVNVQSSTTSDRFSTIFIFGICPHTPSDQAGIHTPPSSWILQETVNRRPVRILLECILVLVGFLPGHTYCLFREIIKNCNYRPQTKLPEGNIFTAVCHSVQGSLPSHNAMTQAEPPQKTDTHLQKRSTGQLECILVKNINRVINVFNVFFFRKLPVNLVSLNMVDF